MSSHGGSHGGSADHSSSGGTQLLKDLGFVAAILVTSAILSVAVAALAVKLGFVDWNALASRVADSNKLVLGSSFAAFAGILWAVLVNAREHIVLAVGAVLFGTAAGLVFREAVLSGVINPDWLGSAIFLISLLFVVWRTNRQLARLSAPHFDLDGWWEDRTLPISFGSSFLIALVLGTYFAAIWNETIGAEYGYHLHVGVEGSEVGSGGIDGIVERSRNLIGVLFAAVTGLTAIFVVQYVSPNLDTVLKYLGLQSDELEAASRLRRPAADAISHDEALVVKYPRQVNITVDSDARHMPLSSRPGNRALIKIYMPQEKAGEPYIKQLNTLLASAEIELEHSLFFIYSEKDLPNHHNLQHASTLPKVIAYGSGAELKDLVQPPGDTQRGRFSAKFSTRLLVALSMGEKHTVKAIIEEARAFALARNPKDDVLLSTFSISASSELKEVLREMSANGLRRVLLTSEKVPHEFAVLGLDDVARFLLPEASKSEHHGPTPTGHHEDQSHGHH